MMSTFKTSESSESIINTNTPVSLTSSCSRHRSKEHVSMLMIDKQ